VSERVKLATNCSCTTSLFTRDGSYGLPRRPIRYNTLLIRNTRIRRIRIYAILGGTLGLHQPPSNHHELSSLQNIIMPPGVKTLSGIVFLLWDRRGRFTRCQMPDARIPRFQQRCPPHPRALYEAESQRRCSSMQS